MTHSIPQLSHVHLKVRDARVAAEFYRRLLGYEISESLESLVFLTAGSRHHDLALQSVGESPESSPLGPRIGLYHVAFEVTSPEELEEMARRLRGLGCPVHGVDHGISHALYSEDPDGNGLEFFLARRQAAGGRPLWHGRSQPLRRASAA
jgi:catechol-2,3-dioxygenase